MRYIFDANISFRLAEGLNILEKGNRNDVGGVIEILHADQIIELGKGATDAQIIEYAGANQTVIISQDDDFKRIKSNKELLKQLHVGYVLYIPPKHGMRYWEMVEAFICGWKDLKEKLHNEHAPFIFKIDKSGKIQKIPL